MKRATATLACVLTALTFACVQAQIWTTPPGIREIPVPALHDIAIASFDQWGPVIYYNPNLIEQAGPLAAAFYMAHEYAHHYLGHIVQQEAWNAHPYLQPWLDADMENEADAYAIEYWVDMGNKAVIQAGAHMLWTANTAGNQTHPPSRARAHNIAVNFLALTGMPLFP